MFTLITIIICILAAMYFNVSALRTGNRVAVFGAILFTNCATFFVLVYAVSYNMVGFVL